MVRNSHEFMILVFSGATDMATRTVLGLVPGQCVDTCSAGAA